MERERVQKAKEIEHLTKDIDEMKYAHDCKMRNLNAEAELKLNKLQFEYDHVEHRFETEKQYWEETTAALNEQLEGLGEQLSFKDEDLENVRN